jgi:phosphoglycerate dehydrogenase-like enzyme
VLFDFDYSHLKDLRDVAPRVKWIQGTSAGLGQLVKRSGLLDSPIVFTTASGVHATSLAEFCLMAMLMFVKDAFALAEDKRLKRWVRFSRPELRGKTVAVFGLGRIGTEVARLSRALGMRAVGVKRVTEGVDAKALHVDKLYRSSDILSMLAEADFVVLACPHTAETEAAIGERELASMKETAVLINIARGAVVDEPALVRALQSGRLAGAALDVFAKEPLPEDSPLWELPNVLFCPHSASTADEENARITDLFCENLRRYLDGRPLQNVLDKNLLYGGPYA